MGAERPFRQPVKCGVRRIAREKGANGPGRRDNPAVDPGEVVAQHWERLQARDWDGRLTRAREYWVDERREELPAERAHWFEDLDD